MDPTNVNCNHYHNNNPNNHTNPHHQFNNQTNQPSLPNQPLEIYLSQLPNNQNDVDSMRTGSKFDFSYHRPPDFHTTTTPHQPLPDSNMYDRIDDMGMGDVAGSGPVKRKFHQVEGLDADNDDNDENDTNDDNDDDDDDNTHSTTTTTNNHSNTATRTAQIKTSTSNTGQSNTSNKTTTVKTTPNTKNNNTITASTTSATNTTTNNTKDSKDEDPIIKKLSPETKPLASTTIINPATTTTTTTTTTFPTTTTTTPQQNIANNKANIGNNLTMGNNVTNPHMGDDNGDDGDDSDVMIVNNYGDRDHFDNYSNSDGCDNDIISIYDDDEDETAVLEGRKHDMVYKKDGIERKYKKAKFGSKMGQFGSKMGHFGEENPFISLSHHQDQSFHDDTNSQFEVRVVGGKVQYGGEGGQCCGNNHHHHPISHLHHT